MAMLAITQKQAVLAAEVKATLPPGEGNGKAPTKPWVLNGAGA